MSSTINWICIKERLPETDKHVLLFSPDERQIILTDLLARSQVCASKKRGQIYQGWLSKGAGWKMWSCLNHPRKGDLPLQLKNVTHWAELNFPNE